MGPIVNTSTTSADALTGTGMCGDGSMALPGVDPKTLHAQGRCGYGPRLPLLAVSPWARHNYVDHAITDQSSILRFIEDNWLGAQRIGQGSFDSITNSINGLFDFKSDPQDCRLILDEKTGEVIRSSSQCPGDSNQ
jgi:phospholipase C